MPITFKVATHKAEIVAGAFDPTNKAGDVLAAPACAPQFRNAGTIRGTSFEEPNATGPAIQIVPSRNGFFHALSEAYNKHHHLVLRPDDVWLAILVQFNYYVNANAEALRASFVAHDDKKALEVERDSLTDFGEFARAMTGEIHKNVVDPTLRSWALPDFSTTTVKDTTVASIMLMATLEAYFQYTFSSVACGIPSVTLEGDKADWEKLLARAAKLKEYGLQTIAWYHLLVPVLTRFVRAFDEPGSEGNVDFWQKVAHYWSGGSGPSYYSGWISAFCAFDQKGRWIGTRLKTPESVNSTVAPEVMSAQEFWATYDRRYDPNQSDDAFLLDRTPYHIVEKVIIPPCYAEVDVILHDKDTGEKVETMMIAGIVATEVLSSRDLFPSQLGLGLDADADAEGVDDVIKPFAGWWLFEKKQ